MLSSPTVGDGAHNTSNGNMRDDTEASAPLLQTDQRRNGSTTKAEGPDQGSASLTSSIANLTNTIIGTGMLATPGALADTGLLLGMVLIAFCGFTSAFGLYLLTRCAARTGTRRNSFYSIALETLPRGARWFDLAIALKCYGVSISYLIICGQLMPQVVLSFARAFHDDPHKVPGVLLDRGFWILIFMIFLVPLCFLRKLDSLRHTSYLSLLAVFYLVIIVIYYSFSPTARASLPPRGEIHTVRFNHHIISIFPVFVFAFTCAQNVFPMYNELFENNEKRVNTAILGSIGAGGIVYEIVGVLGYLTFGSNIGSNIIAMYPSASFFVCFGRLAIVTLTLFSYPLQVHPCRASLDKVLSFSRSDYASAPVAASSAYNGEDGEDAVIDGDTQGLLRPSMRSQPPGEIGLVKWCLLTAGILSTTFIISMFVEDLSLILGFVGAVGSTTISFILPGILYSTMHSDEPHNRLRRPAQILAAWGSFVMVVSLTANILKVMHGPPSSPKDDRIAALLTGNPSSL